MTRAETTNSSHHRAPKIDTLTSLRFFAAIAVVIHHMRDFALLPESFSGYPLDNAVSFFFVLSGFIMYVVHHDIHTGIERRNFVVSRFSRIYPLHILTFVGTFVLLDGDPGRFGVDSSSWLAAILNILLLQAWVPIGKIVFAFNGVSWTISAEMFFYAAFILLVTEFAKRWPLMLAAAGSTVVALIILSDALELANYEDPLNQVNSAGILYVNPLARLFEFVCGMCLGLLWLTKLRHWQIGRPAGTVLEGLALIIFAINTVCVAPITEFVEANISQSAAVWVYHSGALLPSTALLILVMSCEAGLFSQALRIKPLVIGGEISFAIYMIHQLLLRSYAVHADWFRALSTTQVVIAYSAVLLVVCWLTWCYFEVPARVWLRRRLSVGATR